MIRMYRILSYPLVLSVLTITLVCNRTNAHDTPSVVFDEFMVDDSFPNPAGLDVFDIDGDGGMDIIGAGVVGEISWWKDSGTGQSSWSKHIIDDSFDGAIFVDALDMDGDGDGDVLGAAWGQNEVALWRNEGGNPITWTKETIASGMAGAHEVLGTDIDDDGDIDVIGAIAELDAVICWRNDGGTPVHWTEQIIDGDFYGARSVCVADFDNDGDRDIAGACLDGNDVNWWRNDGGVPIQWTEFQVTGAFGGAHMTRVCDMDSDGDMDILASAFAIGTIAWWKNNGGDPVAWTRENVTTSFAGAVTGIPVDLDGDGNWDVVGAAQPSNHLAWWRNSNGEPREWEYNAIDDNFAGAWPVACGDIDDNGRSDIIAGGYDAGAIKYWSNRATWLFPDFSADPSSGHAPLTVEFLDSSTSHPEIVSWQWDFEGDGVFDAEGPGAVHTYEEPGRYTVRLEVSNGIESGTCIKDELIGIFDGESALHFNGDDGYALCPSSSSLALTDAVTVEAWIFPENWGEVESSGYGRIIDKSSVALALHGEGTIYPWHTLMFILKDQSGPPIIATAPEYSISLNEWIHVAAMYNSDTQKIEMFINGNPVSVSLSSEPEGEIRDNMGIDLKIGNGGSNGYTFQGIIDEVRIWNRARAAHELFDFMGEYLSGDEPGIVGYWSMNEGSGDTLFGGTLFGNNAQITDALWVQGVDFETTSLNDLPRIKRLNVLSSLEIRPQPISRETNIAFALPSESNVTVELYDLRGYRLEYIAAREMNEGFHSIHWRPDHARLPSGTYFIRVSDEKNSLTRRCIVID